MPTDQSIAEVERLKEILEAATVVISTNYRGLDVGSMAQLRNVLREAGGRYRVVKNTLVRIAADKAGMPELKALVDGPCGFVIGVGDPVLPAKALLRHIRQNRLEMEIRGAYLDGQVLDADRVQLLASLPSREELLARVLGQLNAPIAGLVTVLSGTLRGLVTVLQRHIDAQGGEPQAEGAEA